MKKFTVIFRSSQSATRSADIAFLQRKYENGHSDFQMADIFSSCELRDVDEIYYWAQTSRPRPVKLSRHETLRAHLSLS